MQDFDLNIAYVYTKVHIVHCTFTMVASLGRRDVDSRSILLFPLSLETVRPVQFPIFKLKSYKFSVLSYVYLQIYHSSCDSTQATRFPHAFENMIGPP